MEKKKILLAVGHRQLEEYLEGELNQDYNFIGPTVHREGIVKLIEQGDPDIIVIRETLEGSTNIVTIVYTIRSKYPDIRIIFLAGNRKPGDELLATLVNYGIYDILYGVNIPASDIINAVKTPNKHADVAHLQPVPTLDEDRNKVSFEMKEQEDDKENQKLDNKYDDEESVEDSLRDDYGQDEPIIENEPVKIKDKRESPISKLTQGIKKPQIPTMSVMREKSHPVSVQNRSSANRVITFIGGKNGVGTSSIGINVAFELAKAGKRVIYLEINERYPAVSYWYELGLTSYGIDSAIEAIQDERYIDVNNAIIHSKELKKSDSPLKSSYRKFPDSLDFMFFSREYITGLKPKMDLKLSKELYMHLLYQEGYDFVFIDVQPDISNQATINGLMFSNLIFSVVTQDVSSIGYHLFHMNELEKRGVSLNSKNSYIINKYVESDIKTKEIKDWVETKDIFTFPLYGEDFTNANLKGLPVTLSSNDVGLKNSVVKIVNKISE